VRTLTPEDVLLDRETHGYLHDAIALLSPRRAEVVRRYYLEGEEMRSIAQEWGVTVSRVSQIAAEAVALLRDGLTPLVGDAVTPQSSKLSAAGIAQYRDQVQAASDLRQRLSTPVARHDT
jgi:RNA polymerase sigma factor for flagellar operon FliA